MVDRQDEVHVIKPPDTRGDSKGPAIGPKYHLVSEAKVSYSSIKFKCFNQPSSCPPAFCGHINIRNNPQSHTTVVLC